MGLTAPYSLGILVWNFYQTFVTVSIEFWLWIEPQIRPTGLAINFLFVTARAERKVRLCVKLFDFFRGWILICLTWNLSRFVPNSVEILGWNFRKKPFRENFQKFCKNQGYPLPKLVKFRPNFCNFILGSYCAEKNPHKHFRMFFAPRQGGTSINESQKEDTGRKSQDVLFSENRFCSLSVWDLLRLTPCVFGLKFLPNIRHCVYWVLAEVWAPDSSHRIGNNFFFRHCQGWKEGSFVCETVWFFSWVITHPFDLKFVAFCPKFSGDSWEEFQDKTIPREFFRNFVKTKTIIYRNLWNSGLIHHCQGWKECSFVCETVWFFTRWIFVHLTWKLLRFVQTKAILYTNLWNFYILSAILFWVHITTRNSPSLLVWNFYQTFFIVFLEFWMIFEPEIPTTRFSMNFLFITFRVEKNDRLCVKLLVFFLGEYSSVWHEICRILSQTQCRFLCWISAKNYFGRIFHKFCANQSYILYKNFWNFALLSAILLWVHISLKNYKKNHVATFIRCLHPA